MESSIGHAAALKLLGRACRPFGFHNARGISLRSCGEENSRDEEESGECDSEFVEATQNQNETNSNDGILQVHSKSPEQQVPTLERVKKDMEFLTKS
ncbi:hypothetical protein MTR_3g052710 [Medicago truncatula]|uniref:Uncharacterized protein n=1 Tax=Medicago truncatula TaxID=3880 RepID=G7J000_MEDTR|nr:hypothetical protein MTR_3g052710 [Medicago truncatula]